MHALGLSLAFVAWIVTYTAFSIWLTIVISRDEHRAACSGAVPSRIGAPAVQSNRATTKLAKSINR